MVKAETKIAVKQSVPVTASVPEKVEEKLLGDAKSFSEDVTTKPKSNSRICLFSLVVLFITIICFIIVIFFKTRANEATFESCVVLDSGSNNALWSNVSWETKEELLMLRKLVGNDNIVNLRPIYRKDLPENYIAYWEVHLGGAMGDRCLIISAGKETGDRRFVEEGALPCPTDQLIQRAQNVRRSCHRFYRLTPRGDMVCEDMTDGRIVAATPNVQVDEGRMNWQELDDAVRKALPRINKEWQRLRTRVLRLPEWAKFQKYSLTDNSLVIPAESDQVEKGELVVTEIGLQPGESAFIPVSQGFRYFKVRFRGFGKKKKPSKKRGGFRRWQKKLCAILCDICETEDNTQVKMDTILVSNKGEKYVRFSIHSDKDFVRRELEDEQVQFQFELRTSDSDLVVINYGVVLQSARVPRDVNLMSGYSLPYMNLFPDYQEHEYGDCLTGSAAVAWAMIFGYYDNLAHKYPDFGYSKRIFKTESTSVAPLNMTADARSFIESLFDVLGSSCSHDGRGETSLIKMRRIERWFRIRQGEKASILSTTKKKNKKHPPSEVAIDLIKSGIPVIINDDHYYKHFSVVTQIRQSTSYWARKCKVDYCLPWEESVVTEFYTHQGWGSKSNRWQSADIWYVAAAIKG